MTGRNRVMEHQAQRPAGGRPGPGRQRAALDLLRYRLAARVARSRWYPDLVRVPVAAVFGLVAFELLRGPDTAAANAGSALMWLLWWPALPVLFLLTGRFWCAVCPFGTISDAVHSVVGVDGTVPRLLRSYGVWVIDVEFLLITWADHVWGIVSSPWGSGVLLMLLVSAVVTAGAFLPRRSFCRYLCFLGGLCGNYARAGMVQLGADPAVCLNCTTRAACYHGNATVQACPLFSFPRTLDTAAACNLCARCVRSCPHDAITVRVRAPFSELWSIRRPQLEQSVLAMVIMGVVLIQNLSEVSGWRPWLYRTSTAVSCPVIVVFSLAFAVTVFLPLALLIMVSAVASRRNGDGVRANVTTFGYALIPLDIAAFVAHTQADALSKGGRLYVTLARLAGAHPVAGSAALASPGTIRLVQWCVIAAGTAAALFTTWRIVRGRYGPSGRPTAGVAWYGGLVVLLGAVNILLFALPAGA